MYNIKRIVPLFLMFFYFVSCTTEEKSEDYSIFENNLPAGGPVLIIENENLGRSIEEILLWLKEKENKEKFQKSLSWLQMESETKMKDVEGFTAKELVEFTNSLK